MKKILIVAYHFYPDITPRAFRAFELTKEFAKQGHEVKVILPKSDFDYGEVCQKYNFSIDFVDYKKSSNNTNPAAMASELTWFKKMIRSVLKTPMQCLFPSGRRLMFYFYAVYKKLKKENANYDMILSIATPYDTHIGAAMAFRGNNQLASAIKVADYGDPLYKNSALPNCPLYYWVDKFIASRFDYITIPTQKALSIYTTFKKQEEIKIIPQGFDFSGTKLAEYAKRKVPTFAYAGTFYEGIRDPTPLLENLAILHKNNVYFKFIVYTKTANPNNMKFLNKYKSLLGDKLVVIDMIPREEAIYELSKMDFLINQENLSESQAPSKMIDYALASRPVFSMRQDNFSKEKFSKFLHGDYSENYLNNFNLSVFDIQNVTHDFLSLMRKK